jgi:flagellar hook-length control protein FliK
VADIMLPPVLSQLTPAASVDPKAQVSSAAKGSFAQHLDRQLKSAQVQKGNLAGGQAAKVAAKVAATATAKPEESDPPATVEALLQQLMAQLKAASTQPDTAQTQGGQWTFQLKDMGLLDKLAQQAGMDPASLAPLQQMMEQKKSIPLSDLFSTLEANFKEMDKATQVTAPETYLPLLESFLSKLQVPPATIQSLDSQGVNGAVGQLDIKAYLQGLQNTPAPAAGAQGQTPSFVMSDVDLEQLKAMLTDAGVPSQKIDEMFPEQMSLQDKALAGIRPEDGNSPVTMTQERLTGILQQAVTAVDEARPKADMPGFVNDLNTILTQAGFQSSDVGWSPVVQGAVKDAYDQLQKMVDMASVKVEKVDGSGAPDPVAGAPAPAEMTPQEMNLAKVKEDTSAVIMARDAESAKELQTSGNQQVSADPESGLGNGDTGGGQTGGDLETLKAAAPKAADAGSDQFTLMSDQLNLDGAAGIGAKTPDQVQADATLKAQPPRPFLSPDLQQFAVDQISQGVLRGLRNNDQHLALTLYPKELGEVKVDMQMRGNNLSLNFVMENQKVKEALQSSMGEFKDNLERRGFNLGAMAVSVDQQQNSANDSGKRQMAAWEQMLSNQPRQGTVAIPSVASPVHVGSSTLRSQQGGISLFV